MYIICLFFIKKCVLLEFNIIFTGTGDWTIFGTHFFSILKHSTLLPIKYTNYSKTLKISQTHAFLYNILYIFIITIIILYIKPVLWNVIIENIMSNCISYTHILINKFEIISCILAYSEWWNWSELWEICVLTGISLSY